MTYYPICMPMGCECKGKLMPSVWDDDNKEEVKDMSKMVAVMSTASLQQYKPYKLPYFNRMLNKPPHRFTL